MSEIPGLNWINYYKIIWKNQEKYMAMGKKKNAGHFFLLLLFLTSKMQSYLSNFCNIVTKSRKKDQRRSKKECLLALTVVEKNILNKWIFTTDNPGFSFKLSKHCLILL